MVDVLKEGETCGFFAANRPIEFVADLLGDFNAMFSDRCFHVVVRNTIRSPVF